MQKPERRPRSQGEAAPVDAEARAAAEVPKRSRIRRRRGPKSGRGPKQDDAAPIDAETREAAEVPKRSCTRRRRGPRCGRVDVGDWFQASLVLGLRPGVLWVLGDGEEPHTAINPKPNTQACIHCGARGSERPGTHRRGRGPLGRGHGVSSGHSQAPARGTTRTGQGRTYREETPAGAHSAQL